MPKREFKQQPAKAAAKAADTPALQTEVGALFSFPKHRMVTIIGVLFILPLPFLLGMVFGRTKFYMQEIKVNGMMSTRTTSAFYSNRTHLHSLPIPSSLTQGAINFAASRQKAYEAENQTKHWKLRGHGHLYHYKNILLAAQVVDQQGKPSAVQMGPNSVQIYNVHPHAQARNDCHLLTLWLRVNGPEIISGKPYAVQAKNDGTSCFWQYDFTIAIPGNYTIDTKLVFWNGRAPVVFYKSEFKRGDDIVKDISGTQCKLVHPGLPDDQLLQQQAPQMTHLMGFKLYSPLMSCCEHCRRTPECQYWATPPKVLPNPTNWQNGCELYFSQDTAEEAIPTNRLIPRIAKRQENEIAKRQRKAQAKADADAQAQAQANAEAQAQANAEAQAQANAAAQAAANAAAQAQANAQLQANMEAQMAADAAAPAAIVAAQNTTQRLRHRRRRRLLKVAQAWGSPYSDNAQVGYFLGCGWSFMFTMEFPCLSGNDDDHVFMEQNQFQVTAPEQKNNSTSLLAVGKSEDAVEVLPEQPLPLCTVSDESLAPNVTAGRWVRKPWPSEEECPPYKEIETDMFKVSRPYPDHPHCWHRGDLTHLSKQCKEMNCEYFKSDSKWTASPIQHEERFYAVWRNYHCDYLEFTHAQLSDCMQKKNIKGIKEKGASIAAMLKHYLDVRLQNVTFPAEGKVMTVYSLEWPHKLWHETPETWKKESEAKPPAQGGEAYWVSPFFTSSEREPYVQVDRGLQFAEVVEPILKAKGYHMINLFDASAAMTYDTAGQADGMHIIGPPLKYAIDRVLHHMCSGVVEGTRA